MPETEPKPIDLDALYEQMMDENEDAIGRAIKKAPDQNPLTPESAPSEPADRS